MCSKNAFLTSVSSGKLDNLNQKFSISLNPLKESGDSPVSPYIAKFGHDFDTPRMCFKNLRCNISINTQLNDTCLTLLNNNILNGIDRGLLTGMILIDLQKAFDTIDHEFFLMKLECMGFDRSTILWFKSYLNNRTFRVNIEDEYSNFRIFTLN